MKNQDLNQLYHCVYNLKYHLVIVTKYRRKIINSDILYRLKIIFENLCLKWECSLEEFNGEKDHIHLPLSLNTKVTTSVFINNLKTVSSRYIRKEFKEHVDIFYTKPVFWSRSYCLLTCGGAPLSVLKQYIEQKEGAE